MFRPAATPPPPRMSRPGSPIMLQALPYEVKQNNPLWGARICKNFGNQWFHGRVVDVEADEQTGELAYCVEYDDGDSEHLAEREVRAHLWRITGAPIRPSCAPTPSHHSSRRSSLAQGDGVHQPLGIALFQDVASPRIGPVFVSLCCLIAIFLASWSWDSSQPELRATESDSILSGLFSEAPAVDVPLEALRNSHSMPGNTFNLAIEPVPHLAARHLNDASDAQDAREFARDGLGKTLKEDAQPKISSSSTSSDVSASISLAPSGPLFNSVDIELSLDSGTSVIEDDGTALAIDPDIFLGSIAFITLVVAFCSLKGSVARDSSTGVLAPQTPLPASDHLGPQLADSPVQMPSNFSDPYTLAAQSPLTFQPTSKATLPSIPQGGLLGSPHVFVPTPSRSSAVQSSGAKNRAETQQVERKEGTTPIRQTRPSRFRYSSGLEQMKAMGFEDTADLRETLTLHQGRVSGALQEYLG